MKKKLLSATLGICLAVTAFGGIVQTNASGLSSILGGIAKVGGVGYVIDKFGPQIDSFLNRLLKQNNLRLVRRSFCCFFLIDLSLFTT